jgi:hypothetical protein
MYTIFYNYVITFIGAFYVCVFHVDLNHSWNILSFILKNFSICCKLGLLAIKSHFVYIEMSLFRSHFLKIAFLDKIVLLGILFCFI